MAIDIRRTKEKLALLAPTWPITLDSLLSREASCPRAMRSACAYASARSWYNFESSLLLLTRNSNSYPWHLRRSTIFLFFSFVPRKINELTRYINWIRNRSSILKMKSIWSIGYVRWWGSICGLKGNNWLCRVWRVMEREY